MVEKNFNNVREFESIIPNQNDNIIGNDNVIINNKECNIKDLFPAPGIIVKDI